MYELRVRVGRERGCESCMGKREWGERVGERGCESWERESGERGCEWGERVCERQDVRVGSREEGA